MLLGETEKKSLERNLIYYDTVAKKRVQSEEFMAGIAKEENNFKYITCLGNSSGGYRVCLPVNGLALDQMFPVCILLCHTG